MKTRILVSLLSIIPLAGTLVRTVPTPRTSPLASTGVKNVQAGQFKARLQQLVILFNTGEFQKGAVVAAQGYRDALQAGQPGIAAQFLNNLGGYRLALHQYRDALRVFLDGRSLAEKASDNVTAGTLDFNIASAYSQLGEIDAAIAAIHRVTARLTGSQRTARLPQLLNFLAALETDQGRLPSAVNIYRQAIAASDRSGDREMYALAWNELGYAYLKHAQLARAEHPLLEAYRVRQLNHLRSIEGSYRNLGMLRLAQGNAPAAAVLLDRAVALSKQPGGLRPNWEVYYARGVVRLEQNRLPESLADLRIAARLARNWRREAFPDDATRISAENMVQKVHAALVEAGNRLYFETREPDLARETFESAEANRAASLRALMAEPRDWRRNLPAEYWETLKKLEAAETALLRSPAALPGAADQQARQLQGELVEWESRAASATDAELPDLLERTQRNLPQNAALFAFHLSSPYSYLWAVSRESFALYRLPAESEIAAQVSDFNKAIRAGSTDTRQQGAQIFRTLFGQIQPLFEQKQHWLLALDAQLFDLPFAALIKETAQGPLYLAERHSFEITSGAGMLSLPATARNIASGPFVGLADPIYNTADPRWSKSRQWSWLSFFTARADDSSGWHLNRLAASAREVADSAAQWSGSPVLLEGADASRNRLEAALRQHPAVLHFATHILESGSSTRSGFIALSLTQAGKPEIVGPAEIATWDLRGALVSLSGCSSGTADVLPATGMMGLTRACQAAGARAVVASRWPTPDDTGALFVAFYRNLGAIPQAGPAVALQRAQIAMIRSGTWRSNPHYWGAYFVTGNQP